MALLVRGSISDTVHCFMSVERNSRVMSERYISLASLIDLVLFCSLVIVSFWKS